MDGDEHDWIFDFVLQFLESDKFDASVMDFVDEKCFVFDSEEENKFIYTDIHKEFKDHIEALISSNLGELGITTELFYESCDKGRNKRDVNKAVFERMIAMDDFQTFKKIMVKRNVELQLEAMQSYSNWEAERGDDEEVTAEEEEQRLLEAVMEASLRETAPLPNPDEYEPGMISGTNLTSSKDDKVQDILRQSLMEMELMHRQEELEQAELEQAVAISLALEEERLRLLYAEAKTLEDTEFDSKNTDPDAKYFAADAKLQGPSAPSGASTVSDSKQPGTPQVKPSDAGEKGARSDDTESKRSRPRVIPAPTSPTAGAASFPDPKPLTFGRRLMTSSKALPPIGSRPAPAEFASELEDKRKQAEEALRKSQEQLNVQRKQEDELRKQLNQVDPEEAERRAKHMREQRDRLVAAKKLEREKKVKEEEERTRALASEIPEAVLRSQAQVAMEAKHSDLDEGEREKETERKRANMRMALARRMKLDLIESEEVKLAQMQEEQFAELDRKLRQVEQLRSDNKKREDLLAEQLRRQQANIARNVQRSAQALRDED